MAKKNNIADIVKGLQLQTGSMTNASSSQVVSQAQLNLRQYEAWNNGRQLAPLPRSLADFVNANYGPMQPPVPSVVNEPEEDGGVRPRRSQYPIGWNLPHNPGSEGFKLASFGNLRAFADSCSLVRRCIELRKNEILALDWDITPTADAAIENRNNPDYLIDFNSRKHEVLKFFKRPDPNYNNFHQWLSVLLEDLFVVDALSLYIQPCRVSGKGLLGTDIGALRAIDGTTIRPLLDVYGNKPTPPNPAYQQYLYGIARSEFEDVITEDDIELEDTEESVKYADSQLLYLPYTVRNWTPYGFPGVEQCLVPIITYLKRQASALEYYTEGSVPALFVIPGNEIQSSSETMQLQEVLNAMAGDQTFKHKIIVLPGGSKTELQKPAVLADKFDEILLEAITMAFDVMPSELGITANKGAGLQIGSSKGGGEAQESIQKRKATLPLLRFLKRSIFDFILQDVCGYTDMEFIWHTGDEEDQAQKANTIIELRNAGIMTTDEARVDLGRNPFGIPMTEDPVYFSAKAAIPLGAINMNQEMEGFGGQPLDDDDDLPAVASDTPAATTAPANDSVVADTTKAAKRAIEGHTAVQLAELENLRRFLKKGRRIEQWKPQHVSNQLISEIAKDLGNDDKSSNQQSQVDSKV